MYIERGESEATRKFACNKLKSVGSLKGTAATCTKAAVMNTAGGGKRNKAPA